MRSGTTATESGHQQHPTRPAWTSWTLLGLGVVSASISAILIRYAGEADALAVSFWRCFAGAALLAPFAARPLRSATKPEFRTAAIAGAFLAVHFATWIQSLALTTVAASVLLVSTTPIFVAVVAWLLFEQKLPALGWTGIAAALTGTALVAGADFEGSSVTGNALALTGGAMAGGYVLAGRAARRTLGILEYAVIAYAVAAALLLPVCLLAGSRLFGYEPHTWLALAGIVAGPQLLGHTVINYVLKDIDATSVSVAIMAEPVIAIALAFVLLGEVPSLLVLPGAAAILVGVGLVSTNSASRDEVVLE